MSFNDHIMSDTSYLIDQISAITDALDRHFDSVSEALKKSLRDSSWLPGYVKPRPPPISRKTPVVALPVGLLEASRIWLSEHRAVTAAVVAFVGTGAFIVWKRGNADRAKRRARRAKNGSRTEVVILAGSPYSPLTRSLSLDLERRGFIVYIPVGTLPEEQIVRSESRADIRPLKLDITSAGKPSTSIFVLNANALVAPIYSRDYPEIHEIYRNTPTPPLQRPTSRFAPGFSPTHSCIHPCCQTHYHDLAA